MAGRSLLVGVSQQQTEGGSSSAIDHWPLHICCFQELEGDVPVALNILCAAVILLLGVYMCAAAAAANAHVHCHPDCPPTMEGAPAFSVATACDLGV